MFWLIYVTVNIQNVLLWLECRMESTAPMINAIVNNALFHVEKPDTLDLFPSSVWEPKIEGLNLYTYVYIYPVRAEIFNRTSCLKTIQTGSKPGNPTYTVRHRLKSFTPCAFVW